MPLWGFQRESTQPAAGANTQAALTRGQQAPFRTGDADEMVSNRNMIVNDLGWVYRENRGSRQIDQVVVAANPGGGSSYNGPAFTGNPDIVQMYVRLNANGFVSANTTNANLYVVFNTPIAFRASGNLCSLTIANTFQGNNAVARLTQALVTATGIINANNTLVFRLPALQGGNGSGPATYKINSQSIVVAGGGNPLYNPDRGITASANLVVSGATSNNLLDGNGFRQVTFRVRRNG